MNFLSSFISARSKREVLLFKILWICGCFFVCFEYFAYPYFLKFQAYKYSKTIQPNFKAQEIEDFLLYFNSTSLPCSQLIEFIQNNAQSIQEINNKDTSSLLYIQGEINIPQFFFLLQKLASPTLLIQEFSLDYQGVFSLVLKNQKINTLYSPTPLKSSPQEILDQFSTPQISLLSFYIPPQSKIIFILEAIFNQKAKINGVWISLGESIEGYILQDIQPHFVILKKDSHSLSLQLKEKRIFQ